MLRKSHHGIRIALKKTFTLLELLLVIGIIALLAGMLLPVLASARGKAVSLKCLGNQKQIGFALNMYLNTFQYTPTVKYSGQEIRYVDLLAEYLIHKGNPVFRCPADMTENPISAKDFVHISYGINTFKSPALATSFWYCVPESLIRKPGEALWLADSLATSGGNCSLSLCGSYTADPTSGYGKYVSYRHQAKKRQFNALFIDGHVTLQTLAQTPYRFWDIDNRWDGE